MQLSQVIESDALRLFLGSTVLGVDIGSRTGKAALFKDGRFFVAQTPTGFDMQSTADELIAELFDDAKASWEDIDYAVGTGYGRVTLRFEKVPYELVTEISCHAMGAHLLNKETRTIIDIGGQDSKAIKVNTETGKVEGFIMNDKCAAGTGRFLEKAATLLELTIDQLGEESVLSDNPAAIGTQCVVFAESEIISLRAKGYAIRDIAAGVHLATAKRVVTLLNRLGVEPGVFFSGGVSNNIGMRKAIEYELNTRNLPIKIDAIHTGALGAAALAAQAFREGAENRSGAAALAVSDRRHISEVIERTEARKRELIRQEDKPLAAYMCSYTPLEIFSAADIPAIRLFTAGNTEEVASGEVITQSVFCDFVKSILGKFQMQDPLYKRVDKIFGFYTCDCIKKVCEATDEFFAPTELYVLPRMKNRTDSREFYREEILNFRDDAEKLSGHAISDENVASQIKLYNEIRETLEEISALRKRPDPPLTGEDFLDLMTAYYYLPPDRLLRSYKKALKRLSSVPDTGRRPIRIMMAGGIVAEGDRRLIHLIEKHMGARVVTEDHCTGVKIAKTRIREGGDPYAALAEGYIDQSPCARMKPLSDRIRYSGDLAEEYAVDGVVYAYLKFCPCYGQTKHKFFQYYQTLGIPVLELPIDYSKSDEGQMKTRLEAFVEVLKEGLVSQNKAAI